MILGVSLNSRVLGLAVLDAQMLVDYRIRLFKERWTAEKLQRIIDCIRQYMNDFAIEHVACMVPYNHHHTPETKKLLSQIKAHCKRKACTVQHYRADALQAIAGAARAKKKALMHALCEQYPELCLAQKKELQNRKKYYSKLFEAVGVAVLHYKHLYD